LQVKAVNNTRHWLKLIGERVKALCKLADVIASTTAKPGSKKQAAKAAEAGAAAAEIKIREAEEKVCL
jgi:hypothetical protein